MRGVLLIFLAACSYRPGVAGGDDDDVPSSDAPPSDGMENPVAPDPLHLAPEDGEAGTGELTLDGAVTIDTDTPRVSVTLPAGVTIDVRPQLDGPDAAVLHVGALTISNGATVTVRGTRPLIIAAATDVSIAGLLDGGGKAKVPGPGGALPGMGPGAGTSGNHGQSDSDTGGGGAGYGVAGANSGAITGCTQSISRGQGGDGYGDVTITQLIGGSGGARSNGTSCLPLDPGGAGGGAIQISALKIAITGAINVGGGGGQGSTDCNVSDVNSGAGGGSGGALVLQAATIVVTGVVAANGGAGGGSSQTGSGNAPPGGDATASLTAALGGIGPRATGGSGGIGGTNPTLGGDAPCGGNSAGGGGAVGRIAVSASWDGAGMFSPAPNATLPN